MDIRRDYTILTETGLGIADHNPLARRLFKDIPGPVAPQLPVQLMINNSCESDESVQQKTSLTPWGAMTTICGFAVGIRRLLAVKLRGQSKMRNKCVSKVWELGDGLSRVPAADGLTVRGKASRRTKCKAHVPGFRRMQEVTVFFLQLCGVLGSRSDPPWYTWCRQESASGIRCAEYFLPMSHKR